MRVAMLVLIAVGILSGAAVAAPPLQVTIDGKAVKFEKPPVMHKGTLMVPARGIFESLGATVKLSGDKLRATKGDLEVEVVVGASVASVRGRLVTLTVPAARLNGQFSVPLRFVAETLNAELKYDSAKNTYAIVTPPPPPVVVAPPPAAPSGPRIDQVTHNARDPLDVGKTLQVYVQGEAGGSATFEIIGVVAGVPMQEEAPGRYAGSLAVTAALKTEKGKLVARLTKNDIESTKEADKPVMLAIPPDLALEPAAGATVEASDFNVGATFRKKVRPDSVRLVLDGVDVTAQATTSAEAVTFTPSESKPGPHEATLDAITEDGQFLRKTWQFTVIAAVAAPTPAPTPTAAPSPTAPVAEILWVVPVDGSTVQTSTRAIQLQLTQAVKPETILVTLDGTRVDHAVSGSGTAITANLSQDMSAGVRQVVFMAADSNGKPISKTWNFTVAAPTPTGPPTLSVTSPGHGDKVGKTFRVQGTTRPGARVKVTASLRSTVLFVAVEGKKISKDGLADLNGKFDILLDEKDLEKYKDLSLDVVARDNDGRESNIVKLKLDRE